jgi:geranylgeranyl diphosphate synthase type II
MTPHVKYGVPSALAISDFLLASSLEQIAKFPSVGYACLGLFVKTFHSMATGQLNDVEGGVLETPETSEWGSNHLLKTASLAVLPFETGAIVGGGSEHQRHALVSFGTFVGLAFQLLNDVRGLLNYERGRSDASSDLRTGKVTPLVSWARQAASSNQLAEIDRLLEQSWPLTDDQVVRLRTILVDLGAHDYAERQAVSLLARARDQLADLEDSLAKRILYNGSAETSFARLAF